MVTLFWRQPLLKYSVNQLAMLAGHFQALMLKLSLIKFRKLLTMEKLAVPKFPTVILALPG